MTSFHILCVAAAPLFKNGEKLNYAGFLMVSASMLEALYLCSNVIGILYIKHNIMISNLIPFTASKPNMQSV